MGERPNFSEIKSYDEFIKYYWYREELVRLCKELQIDHTGNKQDLNNNIRAYFNGEFIKKKTSRSYKKATREITLDCPLLECGFAFNEKFRTFFAQQTGVEPFKFKADMVAAWRKVKEEENKHFTIQDMLDIYYGKSDYAKYDTSSCQWNKFLKDFCADSQNASFHNKLKVAAILWGIVRDSDLPKVYSEDLVKQYAHLLKE